MQQVSSSADRRTVAKHLGYSRCAIYPSTQTFVVVLCFARGPEIGDVRRHDFNSTYPAISTRYLY